MVGGGNRQTGRQTEVIAFQEISTLVRSKNQHVIMIIAFYVFDCIDLVIFWNAGISFQFLMMADKVWVTAAL